MKSRRDSVLVALQIAFEYDGWGPEHVSDMYDTYEATGEKPPCSFDELYSLTQIASKLKSEGRSFDEAEKQMISNRKPDAYGDKQKVFKRCS